VLERLNQANGRLDKGVEDIYLVKI